MATFSKTRIHDKILTLYIDWKQCEPNIFIINRDTKYAEKLIFELDFNTFFYHVRILHLLLYFKDLDTNSNHKDEIVRLLRRLYSSKGGYNPSAYVGAFPISPAPVLSGRNLWPKVKPQINNRKKQTYAIKNQDSNCLVLN